MAVGVLTPCTLNHTPARTHQPVTLDRMTRLDIFRFLFSIAQTMNSDTTTVQLIGDLLFNCGQLDDGKSFFESVPRNSSFVSLAAYIFNACTLNTTPERIQPAILDPSPAVWIAPCVPGE